MAGVETRRDLNFTPDTIPPKPRKPTKGQGARSRGAAAAEAWQASYARRMAEYAVELERWERRWPSQSGSFGPKWVKAALAPFDSDPIVSALMEACPPQYAGGAGKARGE